MKISVPLLVATATAKGGMKEWEVQNAYFAEEEIILSDSNMRSNKQWHECGEAPPTPLNGQGVTCVGNTCMAVCPIGWRSQGRWKIKCRANNTWKHSKFSPCITCPDMSDEVKEAGQRGVQSQSIFDKRNYPVTQFFCGDNTNWLGMKDQWYKKGGDKKDVRCQCRNGQNGDPAWKKSCSWSFNDAPWSSSDVDTVQCKPSSFQPPRPVDEGKKIYRYDLMFQNEIVHPHYEVSMDLKLDENTHQTWSNLFGAHQDFERPVQGGTWVIGGRIPAVFVRPGENKIHVCSAVGTKSMLCWNQPEEYTVGKWFNLKIKQQYELNEYVYKIFIDGELQYQRVNTHPQQFFDVKGRMGNAYEPERNYATSLGRFRNFKFKSFETPQYCVKITSSDDDICRTHPKRRQNSSWDGGAIELFYITEDFEKHVATLNRGQKEVEFCMQIDQVDIEKDIFSLRATSTDGVCITSLTVNNEQLLVGENNDHAYFWMDENDLRCEENYMATDVMEIQNGKVVYSDCKHNNIRPNDLQYEDVTVYKNFDISIMLNLEKNTESGWSNVFGFYQEDAEAFQVGGRVPAVWLRPNSNALHICMAINGRGNNCWTSPEMPLDTWFELRIRQGLFDQVRKRYVYQILIDGELKRYTVNLQPMIFEGVNGIIGNQKIKPERNYKVAAGKFENFKFESLPTEFEVGSDVITPGLSCSASSVNSRIVGGDTSKKGSWPWIVSLVDGDGHYCGGTILSNTRVLTAAHCLVEEDAETLHVNAADVVVRVGNWNHESEEAGEFEVTATKVTVHPKYDSFNDDLTPGYDFAIIEVPDLSTAKPDSCINCYDFACLPTEHAAHGRACWAGGWGAVKHHGDAPSKPKEVGLYILDSEYCAKNSKYADLDPPEIPHDEFEFCAGRPDMNDDGLTEEGKSICQGDSGGPLICNDDGRPVVYGVSSWLQGCGKEGFPSIFAKVASVSDWIKEQM